MKRLFIVLTALLLANAAVKSENMKYNIIPEPVEITEKDGSYTLDCNSAIYYSSAEAVNSVEFLQNYLKEYYGLEVPVKKYSSGKKATGAIILSLKGGEGLSKEGSYTAEVTPQGIVLNAAEPQGLFYAVQTLIQLLPVKSGWAKIKTAKKEAEANGILFMVVPPYTAVLPIPAVKIYDYPRFEYRGMHLDVVRHIYSVEYIKQYIDYLAYHKLNYFHWHLTDDQGWRIENRKYPLLNSIGSWREGTIIGKFPGTGMDSTRYGGYYTREQIRDIVSYAAKRYITVVPEIDIPGHSMAIIASYPEFGTNPEIQKKPAVTWGIFNRQNNVLAPSDDVFKFLEDVFNDVMDLFPSRYIHMGADECSKMWWDRSPKVQQFIKDHDLKDGNGLQKYFAGMVAKVVQKRGREVVGWDEMLDDGLVDGVVVMSWRDEKHGYEAAKQGHKAIMTPIHYSYFNVAYRTNEDSLCHDSWILPVRKVYEFEPVPDSIPGNVAKYIMGGQGCMWTEYFPNRKKLEWGVFPRMSALAEVYWSPRTKKSWTDFAKRMPAQYDRYDLWGAGFCNEFFESEGISRNK